MDFRGLMQINELSWVELSWNFFGTHDPCGPLRPVIRLHSYLSFASRSASGIVHLHESAISSHHLLGGLPRGRSPSTIPSITVFTSLWSSILHMWLNSVSFFCFIKSIMMCGLSTWSLTLLSVTLSFQCTFISNARSFLESAAHKCKTLTRKLIGCILTVEMLTYKSKYLVIWHIQIITIIWTKTRLGDRQVASCCRFATVTDYYARFRRLFVRLRPSAKPAINYVSLYARWRFGASPKKDIKNIYETCFNPCKCKTVYTGKNTESVTYEYYTTHKLKKNTEKTFKNVIKSTRTIYSSFKI